MEPVDQINVVTGQWSLTTGQSESFKDKSKRNNIHQLGCFFTKYTFLRDLTTKKKSFAQTSYFGFANSSKLLQGEERQKIRWSEILILGMEPKCRLIQKQTRYISYIPCMGLCMYCVYNNILFFQIFRFLDVANASSMPHLPSNLILMILPFYRTILPCLEAEKCVKFYFTM